MHQRTFNKILRARGRAERRESKKKRKKNEGNEAEYSILEKFFASDGNRCCWNSARLTSAPEKKKRKKEKKRRIEKKNKRKRGKSNPSQGNGPPTTETATSIRNHIFFPPDPRRVRNFSSKIPRTRGLGQTKNKKKKRKKKEKERKKERKKGETSTKGGDRPIRTFFRKH